VRRSHDGARLVEGVLPSLELLLIRLAHVEASECVEIVALAAHEIRGPLVHAANATREQQLVDVRR